jgi:hypothetical protein
MALPEINVLPVHEIFLPVQKKQFKFVPYTVEQERSMLTALDSDDVPAIVNNYKKLIDVCGNGVDYDQLSAMEFILIAVNLRTKSKGEILDITTKCKKCKQPLKRSIQLEENIITENEDKLTAECRIDDNLAFLISPVNMAFLSAIDKIKTQEDLMLETAVHSIKKVFWREKVYNEFTPDEIKEKISLTHPIIQKIVEKSSSLIKMHMRVDIKCNKCEHEENYVVRDFLKYLT